MRLVVCVMVVCLSGCAASNANQQAQAMPEKSSKADSALKNAVVNSDNTPFIRSQKSVRYVQRRAGNLDDTRAQEVSGMATSNTNSNRLWMINDSGNSAELMAFDTRGKLTTSFATTLTNRDWESLSSFSIGDKHYLLVADTGDNLRAHPNYTLSLFLEPDDEMVEHSFRVGSASKRVLKPIRITRFVYPDGRHNSEAVAVSVVDRKIVLLTKAGTNAGVYSLPLVVDPDPKATYNTLIAKRLGTLRAPQQTVTDRLIGGIAGVDLSQATGLEINAEGDTAFLLTYRGIYRWTRESFKQNWGNVMSQPPELITRHSLAQAEAIALTKNTGQIYVVSENLPSPILELSPQPSDDDTSAPAGLL